MGIVCKRRFPLPLNTRALSLPTIPQSKFSFTPITNNLNMCLCMHACINRCISIYQR